MWSGRIALKTPMLWMLGFFAIFVCGGLTGVMLAAVPLNTQVHDTFFVVAHLHYVLIGGAVFPLFGAFYYWFPKITGRMLSERLGRVGVRSVLRRLQPDVLSDARARTARHAAARLHLSGGDGLGHAEPAGEHRRAADGVRRRCSSSSTRCARCAPARSPPTIRGTPARSSGRRARRRRTAISCVRRPSPAASRSGTTRPISRSWSACAPTCATCW